MRGFHGQNHSRNLQHNAERRDRGRYGDAGRWPQRRNDDPGAPTHYRSRSRDQSASRQSANSRSVSRPREALLSTPPRSSQRDFRNPTRSASTAHNSSFHRYRADEHRREYSPYRPRHYQRKSPSYCTEREEDPRIPRAYPALMRTVQAHRNMQERKPVVCGVLPSSRDAEVIEAKLHLKAFMLKLAVDIDTFFLDHHNQISCEGDVAICKTQEPVNASEMVAVYHFVVHIEERKNRVHAVDVLQYGTKECPYALRMCYQKDH